MSTERGFRFLLVRHHRPSRGLLAVTMAMLLTASLCAQEEPLQVVADSETNVPGFELPFTSFFQLDGVSPDISGRNVVFVAVFPAGIYASFDGEIRVIADINTKYPGSDLLMGFGASTGSDPTISGENVAFSCRNGQPGPGAICAYIDGELRSIAESALTLVPGSAETFGSFHSLDGAGPSISGENVVFAASSTSTNGIYAMIDGELGVIADTNTLVPGVDPPRTFLQFGQLSGTSPSISGRNVAFVGVWMLDSGELRSGLFLSVNGALREIVMYGMPLPPGSAPFCGSGFGNMSYGNGRRPSISGENIAFTTGCGIYAYMDGAVHLIADVNTPAPEGKGAFTGFPVSPSICGENIAFGAGVEGIGLGIFAYIDGELQLIAHEDTPVPGHEKATFTRFFPTDGSEDEGVRPSISGLNVVFAADSLDAGVNGVYAYFGQEEIPTVSAWGLVVLTLILLAAGTLILARRQRIVQS